MGEPEQLCCTVPPINGWNQSAVWRATGGSPLTSLFSSSTPCPLLPAIFGPCQIETIAAAFPSLCVPKQLIEALDCVCTVCIYLVRYSCINVCHRIHLIHSKPKILLDEMKLRDEHETQQSFAIRLSLF